MGDSWDQPDNPRFFHSGILKGRLGYGQHSLDLAPRLSGRGVGRTVEGAFLPPEDRYTEQRWRGMALREPQRFEGSVGDTLVSKSPPPKTGCSPSTHQRPFPLLISPIFVHAPPSRTPQNSMTVVAPSLLSLDPGISEDTSEASGGIQCDLSHLQIRRLRRGASGYRKGQRRTKMRLRTPDSRVAALCSCGAPEPCHLQCPQLICPYSGPCLTPGQSEVG